MSDPATWLPSRRRKQALCAALTLLWAGHALAEPTRMLRPGVVLELHADTQQWHRELQNAVTAHLAAVGAEVRIRTHSEVPTTLSRRIVHARRVAHAHSALGVFWLHSEPEGGWTIQLFVVGDERVLVRRLQASRPDLAMVQSTALVVQSATLALMHGHAISMLPVRARADRAFRRTETRPSETKLTRTGPHTDARLTVSARAGPFAPATRWQRGARVSLGYRWTPHVVLGGAYSFVTASRLQHRAVDLAVRRHPLELQARLQLGRARWSVAFELSALADIVRREAKNPSPAVRNAPDKTWWLLGLAPALSVECRLETSLGLYARASLDLVLNPVDFGAELPQLELILRPYRLRPALELGLAWLP